MKLLSWLELVKLVETSHTVVGVASKCVAIKVIEGNNNSHELPWTRGHCTVPGPQLKKGWPRDWKNMGCDTGKRVGETRLC